MNRFIYLQHPLTQALGMAVLHSFWQGVLIYLFIRMVLSIVPEQKSGVRYGMSYGALSLLFLGFIFSFFSEWQLANHSIRSVATQTGGNLQPDTYTLVLDVWNHLFSFRYINLFSHYMPWVAIIYTIGLLLLCSKMIWNLLRVQYLRKEVMLPVDLLQQRFLQLKEQSGVKKNVLLRFSKKVNVPLMFGYLKPIILVPFSLVNRLDVQQMEAILLHELAHIKRNDYLWNLLQMVMETLLFFNPAAWFVSRIIRLERENRCDDHVLNITKTPLPYAHALLLLEEHRISVSDAVMAASGDNKTSLLNRIKRITTMKGEIKSSQRALTAVSVLLIIVAMVCFATAFGQEKKDNGKPEKLTKSYSKVVVVDDNGKVTTYPNSNGDTAGMADAMKAIPKALEMAHESLKAMDMDDIKKTVELSMAHADKALKEIDWDDIQVKVDGAMREARKSMKEVDWDEINKEMEGARKEIAQAMTEVHVEMKDVDWSEINKAIDQAKDEIKKSKVIIKKSVKADKHDDEEED